MSIPYRLSSNPRGRRKYEYFVRNQWLSAVSCCIMLGVRASDFYNRVHRGWTEEELVAGRQRPPNRARCNILCRTRKGTDKLEYWINKEWHTEAWLANYLYHIPLELLIQRIDAGWTETELARGVR